MFPERGKGTRRDGGVVALLESLCNIASDRPVEVKRHSNLDTLSKHFLASKKIGKHHRIAEYDDGSTSIFQNDQSYFHTTNID